MTSIRSYNKRLEALKSERSSFISLYRELSDYHLAHRGRFLVSDRNKGFKRNTKQINNTSRLSTRTLASGMMAGITSPARPWFRLSAGDPALDESAAVKQWLFEVQELMYRVFSASNTYNTLHQAYSELGVFGVGPVGVFEDFDSVIRCKAYTVGSYMIANNGLDVVDTFYREYDITVTQCVDQFGIENCLRSTQQMYENGNTEAWVTVVHVVEPNVNRRNGSPLSVDKAYRSVYYERASGTKEAEEKFLRQSGFDDNPILVPRWDVTGEDVYATDCPGMTALGDTKSLQLGEKRMYQALDKIVSPPLQGPAALKNKIGKGGLKPNEIVWTDGAEGLKSIYNYNPDINKMQQVNDVAEGRIKRAFYEDLFLMLANTDRRQITAREVAEKHEEKLLMLGPVLERLHTELLDPLIDRTFNILQRNGVLPVAPDELKNRELNVEYVSVLAQAQRMAASGSVEQLTAFAGNMAALWPEARHKINAAQAIDDYADALGVNPSIIRSDDQVAEMQAADQAAQQQQQQAAQAAAMVDSAKTASEIDTSEGSTINKLMGGEGI